MNRLCCLLNPEGRCEYCGTLFCFQCNRARTLAKGACPSKGVNTGKTSDNHWVTSGELEAWQQGRSLLKDNLATE